jgi:hypothetical protein
MIDIIRNTINKFELGYVFTADDFSMEVNNPCEASRLLNNLVREGKLRKLSKGKFYKPKMGKFGELPPDAYQIVKDLLVEDGKITGYITGYQVFNSLLLTTQVPAVLQIGTIKEKKNTQRLNYRIKFVKQWNTLTKENIPLLQLLDCLRFFNNIPDARPDDSCKRLIYLLSQLSENQKSRIKNLR